MDAKMVVMVEFNVCNNDQTSVAVVRHLPSDINIDFRRLFNT